LNIVATTNVYTAKEDLSEANIKVTCLGDSASDGCELKAGGEGMDYDGVLHLEQLMAYFVD